MDYLKDKSNLFAVGFHAYHTFSSDQKEATLIDYSQKYEVLSKVVIGYSLLVSVAVDALILWLTRGRYAFVKGAHAAKKASLLIRLREVHEKVLRGELKKYDELTEYRDLENKIGNTYTYLIQKTGKEETEKYYIDAIYIE